MNLRILKKLSKRAAPLLPLLKYECEQFPAVKDDNYTGLLIRARKHWDRGRSTHADIIGHGEIKYRAKDGNGWVYLAPPVHPRKGTIMVGGMSGYYEPEWSEETTWEVLREIVFWHFTEFDGDDIKPTRALRTPSDVLRGAREILGARS